MYRLQNIDALEGIKQMEDESVDIIITSPPYNKAGLNGNYNKKHKRTIDYGGDINIDNRPEEEYQEWQIEILNECHRVLKKDGLLFYNHKNRIVRGKGYIISPYSWLLKTPFLIRQEIIWNRKNGPNPDPSRYVPTYENIYVLSKSKDTIFKRNKDVEHKTDIWTINPDRKNNHPAPFPIDIPRNILSSLNADKIKDRAITVFDPFNGSGTTGVAAIENGFNYIGFDIIDEYLQETEGKIEEIIKMA
jgi:modification methylase